MSEAPDDIAPSPGAALSTARLRAGLSLYEVARRTRVPRHALEALEADRWEALPAAVYVRGFIRLYAEAVDLDPAVPLALHADRLRERAAAEEAADIADEARQRRARWMRLRVRATYALAIGALIAVFLAALFSVSPQRLEARDLAPDAAPAADASP